MFQFDGIPIMAKDVDGDGQLRFGEFLCAMHLAERHNTVTDLGSLPGRWALRADASG